MNPEFLKQLLRDVYERKADPEEAFRKLKNMPYENLGFARIDHHRAIRGAMPEVIYCEGKTPEQILLIVKSMMKAESDILATRVHPEVYAKLKPSLPAKAVYNPSGRTLVLKRKKNVKKTGSIIIATAGTADIPVAEEAAVTADLLGSRVETTFDIGVAGIHRVFDQIETFRKARVAVVVAGMDGALASVVGGLISAPVIAVPTSVGYGASFQGLAALLAMLNSCASGVAVVNIDNGFGAGCLAHKINQLGETEV
ncbi:MAG: nickel pincer cofactor biosynthesis protein LarB [Nitrospinales bacterium]